VRHVPLRWLRLRLRLRSLVLLRTQLWLRLRRFLRQWLQLVR
jgi:hypothetical protein